MKALTKKQQKQAELALNSIAKNSNAYKSCVKLLNYGVTRTGSSGYSKGYANKSVWTDMVVYVMNQTGIAFEKGNDAPRGGANGEFVRITDKNILKRIEKERKNNAIIAQKRREEAEAKALEEARIKAEIYEKEKAMFVVDTQFLAERSEAYKMPKHAKHNALISAMKSLMERNGIERVQNFYKLMNDLK